MPSFLRLEAGKDLSLAKAVLVHCRFRFTPCRRLRPIGNKAGYLVGCIRRPAENGFTRNSEGIWLAPDGQPPRPEARTSLADRMEESAKRRADQAMEAAEKEKRIHEEWLRIKRWDARPEDLKAKVRQIVRQNEPLQSRGKHDEHIDFKSRCVALAEDMERHGALF